MSLEVEQFPPLMMRIKSAGCLTLNLNTRLQKKNQIKLLSAKLRNLRNTFVKLRQESKTDKKTLSDLMTVNNQLENRTNERIQACKIVQSELILKQQEIHSIAIDESFDWIANEVLNTKINPEVEQNNIESTQVTQMLQDQVLQTSLEQIIAEEMENFKIYHAPIEESMTTSWKSQGDQEEESDEKSYETQNYMRSDSNELEFEQTNTTIISSVKKSPVCYRRNSSKSEKSKLQFKPGTENLFIKYIYAVIVTIVLTIIFFNVII